MTILLADDSVPAQNMGKKILTDAGFNVVAVSNGLEALRKIKENKPDMAILDIFMPGYNGLELCEKLRADSATSAMPIVLTVGKLEPFRPEEAKQARSNGVIVKPFSAAELLNVVQEVGVPAPAAAAPAQASSDTEDDHVAESFEPPAMAPVGDEPAQPSHESAVGEAATPAADDSEDDYGAKPASMLFDPDAAHIPFSASAADMLPTFTAEAEAEPSEEFMLEPEQSVYAAGPDPELTMLDLPSADAGPAENYGAGLIENYGAGDEIVADLAAPGELPSPASEGEAAAEAPGLSLDIPERDPMMEFGEVAQESPAAEPSPAEAVTRAGELDTLETEAARKAAFDALFDAADFDVEEEPPAPVAPHGDHGVMPHFASHLEMPVDVAFDREIEVSSKPVALHASAASDPLLEIEDTDAPAELSDPIDEAASAQPKFDSLLMHDQPAAAADFPDPLLQLDGPEPAPAQPEAQVDPLPAIEAAPVTTEAALDASVAPYPSAAAGGASVAPYPAASQEAAAPEEIHSPVEALQMEASPLQPALQDAPLAAPLADQPAIAESAHAEQESVKPQPAAAEVAMPQRAETQAAEVERPAVLSSEAERVHQAVERVFARYKPLLVAAIVREMARSSD